MIDIKELEELLEFVRGLEQAKEEDYERVVSALEAVQHEEAVLEKSIKAYLRSKPSRKRRWVWPTTRETVERKRRLAEEAYSLFCKKFPDIVMRKEFGNL